MRHSLRYAREIGIIRQKNSEHPGKNRYLYSIPVVPCLPRLWGYRVLPETLRVLQEAERQVEWARVQGLEMLDQ